MNKLISNKIKYLSFTMTCVILLYHCSLFDEINAIGIIDARANTIINDIFAKMGTLAMSYFFTVTGYLLFCDLSMKTYLPKIKRRFFTLFIPYVLWQCIFFIKSFIVAKPWTIKSFLYNTFALETWPIDGALWYVYAVFLLALISPILLFLFHNKRVGGVVLLILIVGTQLVLKTDVFSNIISHGYIRNIVGYLPAYLIGAFYGKFLHDLTNMETIVYAISVMVVSLLLSGMIPDIFNDVTIRVLPILLLYSLPQMPKFNDLKVYKLSFLVYAIHQPVIVDFGNYFSSFWMSLSLPISLGNILIRTLFLLMTFLLAFFLYKLLSKFTPKFLILLTGGRI